MTTNKTTEATYAVARSVGYRKVQKRPTLLSVTPTTKPRRERL
jgi:hypothetical protein